VIHCDTSFLIDLHQEVRSERPGPAFELLESLDDTEILAVSVHVLCELRAGAELARHVVREHEALDQLLDGFVIAHTDDRFAPAYARLFASLGRAKRHVASMDLLISTAALLDDAQLITRNVKDFSRVPGLRVLSY
jgi:predicted nucleic acid-binding protein